MPGEFILLFTILIWLLFSLIYISNRQNRLNRWCFISGMCFSLGVFKEYFYFSLCPYLQELMPSFINETSSLYIYSVMTAILYYFAMPTALIFAYYFAHLHQRFPKQTPWLKCLAFLPGLLCGIFYPYIDTRTFQTCDEGYFIFASIYNGVYGILFTWLIILGLKKARFSQNYQQKKMVAVIVLVPIWYWLFTVFLVHSLGLKDLFKAWQGNVVIILCLVIYYLYHAFKGGIMGARFNREVYDWDSGQRGISQGAQFASHYLKNETAKIDWCLSNLKKKLAPQPPEELEVIGRSVERLRYFVNKTRVYSQNITLYFEECRLYPFLQNMVSDMRHSLPKAIVFHVECAEDAVICCDTLHISEVLSNLITNAVEALGKGGNIFISFQKNDKKKGSILSISNDGAPLGEEEYAHLFEPYHTTKQDGQHFGLGLYYCRNVMEKHGGFIKAEYRDGITTFSLHFPKDPTHKKRRR